MSKEPTEDILDAGALMGSCPLPILDHKQIVLGHGSGGKLTHEQQGRQRRALRGLGTAEALFSRASRGLQIAAVGFFTREEEMHHA